MAIGNSERREIFFGLIAPIGVDLNAVQLAMETSLKRVRYDINCIKLTEIFEDHPDLYDTKFDSEFERYEKLISAGDQICKDTKRNDVLALYGVEKLKKRDKRGVEDQIPKNVAHVFRQIKRVDEINTLKKIFGRNILFISCYSPKAQRVEYLVRKLLTTERGKNRSHLESLALQIISIDENEKEKDSGQRVMECYPHADFVLDCTNNITLSSSSDRLIDIYFGHPFMSPTKDEYCSYFANAASYRSLDLSRQVGAGIFTDECEVIALGCNEVPKAGGGTYWGENGCDFRDYAKGADSNQQVKEDMARDALVRLQKDWLSDKYKNLSPNRLSYQALEGSNAPLKNSMINDVIEYGRMVHAEMNVITDAARSRKSTLGANLYCTTMPCHMCTKLIIASGIKRVIYLQPYPKSLVEELFSDSVTIDCPSTDKVSFETLKGVTPNGFRLAFRKTKKRKNSDGTVITWDPPSSSPEFLSYYPYYRQIEILSSVEFNSIVESLYPADEELK